MHYESARRDAGPLEKSESIACNPHNTNSLPMIKGSRFLAERLFKKAHAGLWGYGVQCDLVLGATPESGMSQVNAHPRILIKDSRGQPAFAESTLLHQDSEDRCQWTLKQQNPAVASNSEVPA